jgi:hypothetical protein
MTWFTKISNWVGRRITKSQKRQLRPLWAFGVRVFYGRSLSMLAKLYWSDKFGGHFYTPHYERHFAAFRRKKFTLLEIGIGGNDDPKSGGASLRMWKTYFPKANICGIDIADKKLHEEARIRTFQGSQDDEVFLTGVMARISPVDIIIDDGSHQNAHVIKTFSVLFPLLSMGGIYVIEDTQTSYWSEYGGSSTDLNNPNTIMGFFKGLVDGLNVDELRNKDRFKTYFDRNIVAIHFYHNLIFIYKGLNNEGSFSY